MTTPTPTRKATMPQHHATSAAWRFPATEPGALPGWAAKCACGDTYTSSLSEDHAARQCIDHVHYMRSRKAG